ncbi:MAG: leucine-rich repeat protein [Bacteroidaceae bacterium]|nr:leucine-rich repeat protein [Bacteroidaceae bacterium]
MKRYIFYIFALIFMQDVMAQASGSLTGTQATINGLNYRLDEETQEATLDNGNCWDGTLSLPSVVNYNGKDYPVTRIGWLAFAFCETLTGIKIPGTIREILHYASYEGCKNPFLGCTNLESIEVDENNEWMCSVDGVLFNKDKTWLYAYPAGAQRSSYIIPDCVTTIAGDAFSYNLSLRSVIMPNSVEKEFFSTFNGCRNLETVSFSENLKSLGACSFDNCESIRVIDLPKSVSYFAESVFRWTHLDALVVRGTFPATLRSDTFYFVDDSMIIYAQPSEIPKFKKVFSGTVLPLEDYVDAVHAPQSSTINHDLSNHQYYDLSGRRLVTPPTRGLFIRDGKVVIK